jgi:hypothetical protein
MLNVLYIYLLISFIEDLNIQDSKMINSYSELHQKLKNILIFSQP